MAKHDVGFLDGLGIGGDENAAVTSQRNALLNRVEEARLAQGRTAGRGLAGFLGGAASLVKNRSFKGIGQAIGRAFTNATDADVSRQTGLTVDQLRGRREMRKLAQDQPADSSFESRIALVRKIADIANRSGDSDVLGNSLKRITELRKSSEEFDKLKAEVTIKEAEADESDVIQATYAGVDIDGTLAQDEDGNKGLKLFLDGKFQFKPWSDELLHRKILKGTLPKSDDEHISSTLGKAVFNAVRGQIVTNRSTIKKYDAILTTLSKAMKEGNVQSIVGGSGKVLSTLDNVIRSMKGILASFGGALAGSAAQKDRWMAMANNPRASIWDEVALPASVQEDSAQAQLYRSRIMELAYLSAAAAEPSGRGLSDSDIKNALIRLGAESGNPAIMFRRAMETVAAGANTVNTVLEGHYGGFTRRDGTKISDEIIDSVLAGRGLSLYRQELKQLYQKHGVRIVGDNQAIFEDLIDADVQPDDPGDDTLDLAPGNELSEVDAFIGASSTEVNEFFREDDNATDNTQ